MINENTLMQVQILRGQLATIQDGLKALQDSIAREQGRFTQSDSPRKYRKPSAGHYRLIEAMECRTYPVTIQTLARDARLSVGTCRTYIKELKSHGYKIETLRTGQPKARYLLAS